MANNRLRDFVFAEEKNSSPLNNDTMKLTLAQINLPSNQPRHYFDETKLKELAESIRNHGILEPLLVRKLPDGTFELVAGERRLRASIMLGLTEVPVIVRELSNEAAMEIAIVENLQREDLNPWEETNGILRLLSIKVNKTVEEITALLYRMMREERGKTGKNPDYLVMGTESANQVISSFATLGLMSWQSFVTNRLPILNLPADIKDSLAEGKIAYTKAIALAKLKDEEKRINLLAEVIEHNLSLKEIKERIKQLQPKPELDSPKQRIDKLVKDINKVKLWEKEPKKWRKIEGWLSKIENILDDETII